MLVSCARYNPETHHGIDPSRILLGKMPGEISYGQYYGFNNSGEIEASESEASQTHTGQLSEWGALAQRSNSVVINLDIDANNPSQLEGPEVKFNSTAPTTGLGLALGVLKGFYKNMIGNGEQSNRSYFARNLFDQETWNQNFASSESLERNSLTDNSGTQNTPSQSETIWVKALPFAGKVAGRISADIANKAKLGSLRKMKFHYVHENGEREKIIPSNSVPGLDPGDYVVHDFHIDYAKSIVSGLGERFKCEI